MADFAITFIYAKQKLQQEAELLLSRRGYFETKFNNINKEIETLIETKHSNDSLRAQSLKNQWKIESQNEEIKSKEMWQRAFKTTSNIRKPKPNKEKCKSISRAPKPLAIQNDSKTEQTPDSKCTQLLNNIKQ